MGWGCETEKEMSSELLTLGVGLLVHLVDSSQLPDHLSSAQKKEKITPTSSNLHAQVFPLLENAAATEVVAPPPVPLFSG